MFRHPGSSWLIAWLFTACPLCGQEPAKKEKKARLDVHGDALPDGALARMGTLRWQVRGKVSCVAVSSDGKVLALGAEDGSIALWEMKTGTELRRTMRVDSDVGALVFSPDGKSLASSSSDGEVRLWDVATGRTLLVFDTT